MGSRCHYPFSDRGGVRAHLLSIPLRTARRLIVPKGGSTARPAAAIKRDVGLVGPGLALAKATPRGGPTQTTKNVCQETGNHDLALRSCSSTPRLYRLRKNRQSCHPEEPKATKDLCSCLIPKMQRFFASLRMTARTRFPAAFLTPRDGKIAPIHRGATGRRASVLMSPRECQCKAPVSAAACSVAASLPHGGTANFGVLKGVNKETRLASSVPDNQQKRGSPKLTPVGGSHGKQVTRACFEDPRLFRPRTADLKKTEATRWGPTGC
jgi:hypothetical protein